MRRSLLIVLMVVVGACRGGSRSERAVPGQRLVSPNGRYVAVVTRPSTDEPGQLSFRIENANRAIELICPDRWSDRHRLIFVWDANDRLWAYSSDVGTDVWERHADGTWSARAWVQTDLTPPPALAPYLQRADGVSHAGSMGKRTLYEGQIEVSRTDYTNPIEQGDDFVDVEIRGLDERVTSRPILRFTLDYPFERPYQGEVVTDGGASLRQIIDAVRAAYRQMYRDVTIEPIANLDNKRVRGEYGEALHVIEDLVIESIELDEQSGQLQIFIGS